MELLGTFRESLILAANNLSGAVRRAFMANVVEALGSGGQREAERVLGWNRETIRKGVSELRSGHPSVDHRRFNGPGRSVEVRLPRLRDDIRDIVEPNLQQDPKFTSARLYCRLSVAGIVGALIEHKGYSPLKLPSDESFRRLLNDMEYTLRKVRKCKPLKRVHETDAIFECVHELNDTADASKDDQILRMSIDAKNRVKVGALSRGGYSRGAREAEDHDFNVKETLVPVGIFLPKYDELYVDFCYDRAPADAWVDSLERFWHEQKHRFPNTTHLLLNLDNGPENSSRRTQFMARLVEFAYRTGLMITLAYYPPYLSKYNAVERCWGVLENFWSGELLDSVEAVLGFASKMTYNGVKPVVHLVTDVYQRGVKLSKKAMVEVNKRLDRAEELPKYHVTITPGDASQ